MRTTLTLDPDVAALLAEEARRQRKPFKQVVNEALRRGLSVARQPRQAPFRITPHEAKLMPGIDRASFNRLADELEDEHLLGRLAPRCSFPTSICSCMPTSTRRRSTAPPGAGSKSF